jgi:glycerate kinase
VACDVRALFADAARLFGAQKGATPVQIEFLSGRLEQLQQSYLRDYGIDVSQLIGGGAAGGLAGGLSALGASLVPGFDVVADEVGLHEQIAQCDLIITGEGYLDNESFDGKVVGGVQQLAQQFNKPVVVICGGADVDAQQRIESLSLIENFGESESFSQPLTCIEKAATAIVARFM